MIDVQKNVWYGRGEKIDENLIKIQKERVLNGRKENKKREKYI